MGEEDGEKTRGTRTLSTCINHENGAAERLQPGESWREKPQANSTHLDAHTHTHTHTSIHTLNLHICINTHV